MLAEYRKDADRHILVLLTEPNGKTNWWGVDQVRGKEGRGGGIGNRLWMPLDDRHSWMTPMAYLSHLFTPGLITPSRGDTTWPVPRYAAYA